MAAALQFDTLEYARKLETAGVAAPQAEAQARALAEVLSQAVAPPNDLKVLESNLEARFSSMDARLGTVETRLDAKIDAVKLELGGKIDKLGASVDTLKWLFGLVAAMNLATFVRLVVHP